MLDLGNMLCCMAGSPAKLLFLWREGRSFCCWMLLFCTRTVLSFCLWMLDIILLTPSSVSTIWPCMCTNFPNAAFNHWSSWSVGSFSSWTWFSSWWLVGLSLCCYSSLKKTSFSWSVSVSDIFFRGVNSITGIKILLYPRSCHHKYVTSRAVAVIFV